MSDNEFAIEHPFITQDSKPLLSGQDSRSKKAVIRSLDWRELAGALLFTAGLIVLFIGWYQVSGTRDTADQLTYLVSGGVFGLALLGLGAVCFMANEHRTDREALASISERLVLLEHGLAGEFDALDATLQSIGRNGTKSVAEVALRSARAGRAAD